MPHEVFRLLQNTIPYRLGLIENSDDQETALHSSDFIREALMMAVSGIRAYGRAMAEHALERAAKLCDEEKDKYTAEADRGDGRLSDMAFGRVRGSQHLAAAIRAAAPPQGERP